MAIKYMEMNKNDLKYKYLNRLIRLKQEGVLLSELLDKRGLKKIALYGFIDMTKSIIVELSNSNIHIDCIIDKNKKRITHYNFPIISIDDVNLLTVDAIIIMPVAPYQEIIDELKKYTKILLISFEEIIYEL